MKKVIGFIAVLVLTMSMLCTSVFAAVEPTSLKVTGIGDKKVSLQWDIVEGVTEYKVKYGTTPSIYSSIKPVTVTESVYGTSDIEGLTNGTTYYFTVCAVMNGVEKELSNEVWATPKAAPKATFASLNTQDNWETKASMQYPRYMLGVAAVGNKIYAIGGDDKNAGVLDKVEEYDIQTDTWTTKSNIPKANSGFGCIAVDGKIYVIGGGTDRPGQFYNSVELYDPVTDKWTTKSSLGGGRTRFGISCIDGKIYVIGGDNCNGNEVIEYNTQNNTRKDVASMPTARAAVGAATFNNKIYVFGGISQVESLVVKHNIVEEYDPKSNTWTTKANMPTARYGCRAVEQNGKIYIIGGQDSSNNNLNTVDVYDPVNDTWSTGPDMPEARREPAALNVDGSIYVIGGYQQSPSLHLSSVKVLKSGTITPNTQIKLIATGGDSKVELSWNTIEGASAYIVKRSTTSGGPYTVINDKLTANSYTDTGVTNGTTYYYIVTAVNAAGEIGTSNEASATPNVTQPPHPVGNRAILVITMTNGSMQEYDLTMTEVNAFVKWYEDKSDGSGKSVYSINKSSNIAPFLARKDYIHFEKIYSFEVKEYKSN